MTASTTVPPCPSDSAPPPPPEILPTPASTPTSSPTESQRVFQTLFAIFPLYSTVFDPILMFIWPHGPFIKPTFWLITSLLVWFILTLFPYFLSSNYINTRYMAVFEYTALLLCFVVPLSTILGIIPFALVLKLPFEAIIRLKTNSDVLITTGTAYDSIWLPFRQFWVWIKETKEKLKRQLSAAEAETQTGTRGAMRVRGAGRVTPGDSPNTSSISSTAPLLLPSPSLPPPYPNQGHTTMGSSA